MVSSLVRSVAMSSACYAMMSLQSTVNTNMGFGIVGTLFKDGPLRAQPGIIDSVGTVNPNRVGRAFTQVAADGHCTIGGAGIFFGILADPKTYASLGTAAGTLAATLDLPQYAQGEFVYSTTGLIVRLEAAGNIGDLVDFDTTTGQLYPRPIVAAPAAGTVAVAANVATVAALTAGSPAIGIGTVLNTLNGPATVQSLGTGAGGNGTYNISPVPNSAATAFTYQTSAPTGRAEIPRARVMFYSTTAAGNAVISMAN